MKILISYRFKWTWIVAKIILNKWSWSFPIIITFEKTQMFFFDSIIPLVSLHKKYY